MEKILLLAHLDESGSALPRAAREALAAALELSSALAAPLTVGLIGENVEAAANSMVGCGAKILATTGAELSQPRYATDSAAIEAICRKAEPTLVLAPATSRFARVMGGAAQLLGGHIDTHITALAAADGAPRATRWFYRQRVEAVLTRTARPWFLLLDPGTRAQWDGPVCTASVENVTVTLPPTRTQVTCIRAPKQDEQTIRPDAKLLFVAGAGWTKKQADGQVHVADAEQLILGFLKGSGASLGSSKSLVDQTGEGQTALPFMSHLNQVGQTGATPRHPKGLSTCCHGEEPHVVGWRFIGERRAVNLDANCGWARGKADVLYVADAFQVVKAVNELLATRGKP